MKSGIFVVAELRDPVREQVRAIQRWSDLRLAQGSEPHVTLAGSSGVGPMTLGTTVERIRELVEPITRETPPLSLLFGAPVRYMQTEIIALPLDPHGPLRALHERIATSGLPFEPGRFTFSPHVTLNFYATLTPERERRLMRVRLDEPVVIDRIQFYETPFPQPSRRILELPLTG